MTLARRHRQSLYDDGYTLVQGLVPEQCVLQARRAINQSFGRGIDPARIAEFEHQSFCPELRDAPVIHQLLLNKPTRTAVEDLIGPGSIDETNIRPQMAIRFPTFDDTPHEVFPHLDGMYTPDNGLEPGDFWSHTLLVGVFLNDIVDEQCGNFTAWPGSHHKYERYFRQEGSDALLNGMPEIDIGDPVQIKANSGDVLLAHYQLGHSVGCHLGSDVRYTVFFRVRHPNHEQQKWKATTDIWTEWPGIAGVLPDVP